MSIVAYCSSQIRHGLKKLLQGEDMSRRSSKVSYDEADARKLWAVSEELTAATRASAAA